MVAGGREREGGLEQNMRLVPVDLVVDVDLIPPAEGVMVCTNFEFCQVRVTRMAGSACRSSTSSTESTLIEQRRSCIERAGIDVPGVVFFRRVFEGLQLVAAASQ